MFTERALIILFAFSSIQISCYAQNLPEQAKNYYDFWIGNWNVEWDEADGKTGAGTNHIEKILDGKVIQEHFTISEGENAGFKGTSISVYNSNKDQWKQAWADNNGGYFDFTGTTEGNKRIFQTQVFERQNGDKFIQRMVFYNIEENSFTWDWEASTDGGINWDLNWRIKYQRVLNKPQGH